MFIIHMKKEVLRMGEYPRISISEMVSEIHLVYGQTITLWLNEKGKKTRHQVEIRITEEGKMEIYLNKDDSPIEIKDFSEWKNINS